MCVVAAGQQLNGKIMRLWRWDQIGDSLELIERISSPVRSYSWWCADFRAPRCLRVLDRAAGFEMRAWFRCPLPLVPGRRAA